MFCVLKMHINLLVDQEGHRLIVWVRLGSPNLKAVTGLGLHLPLPSQTLTESNPSLYGWLVFLVSPPCFFSLSICLNPPTTWNFVTIGVFQPVAWYSVVVSVRMHFQTGCFSRSTRKGSTKRRRRSTPVPTLTASTRLMTRAT